MAKPPYMELGDGGPRFPILHEDRSALAIDKAAGWMLVPTDWQRTSRNLQAAIESSVAAGDFWARSRSLRFLRYVHRLDAETSGVLLLAKQQGALDALSSLFETRSVTKQYLAIVHGEPAEETWTCRFPLAPDPRHRGRVVRDDRGGKEAETKFRALLVQDAPPLGLRTLVEAQPMTGRTHQIRVHLAECGHPVLGDSMYGEWRPLRGLPVSFPLGLRAVVLGYTDPFTRRPVRIEAPREEFLRAYGFGSS
jgi:RluA family pseudouridine synthase